MMLWVQRRGQKSVFLFAPYSRPCCIAALTKAFLRRRNREGKIANRLAAAVSAANSKRKRHAYHDSFAVHKPLRDNP
jgi:hypothetical protein